MLVSSWSSHDQRNFPLHRNRPRTTSFEDQRLMRGFIRGEQEDEKEEEWLEDGEKTGTDREETVIIKEKRGRMKKASVEERKKD